VSYDVGIVDRHTTAKRRVVSPELAKSARALGIQKQPSDLGRNEYWVAALSVVFRNDSRRCLKSQVADQREQRFRQDCRMIARVDDDRCGSVKLRDRNGETGSDRLEHRRIGITYGTTEWPIPKRRGDCVSFMAEHDDDAVAKRSD